MASKSARPTSQPHNTIERRLRVAMRMSQLATARALIFIVGIACALFGFISLTLERQMVSHRLAAETELIEDEGGPEAGRQDRFHRVSKDEQSLYAAIAGYGLICLLLAKFLYHAPMMAPVLAMIGFAVAFAVFLKLNHSESPVLYTVSSLAILGALILAIRAGHQFQLSYARMGRPDEK